MSTRATNFRIAGIIAILLFFSAGTMAATPQKINYQGFLRSSGLPANTTLNMIFDLYDAPAAGVLLCSSGAQSITISYGRFNYVIGTNGCDLSTIDWQTNSVYLEITVDGNTMSPREQVVASAYSLSNDSGTPETTFTLDVDNQVAGASSSLVFNRGADSANDASITWDEGNDRFSLTSDGATLATVLMGTASATTYFGDGSNLTGISTGGVATTGDNMTGPLNISMGDGFATSSISAYHAGTDGRAGYFEASNSGSGLEVMKVVSNTLAGGIYAYHTGNDGYAINANVDNTVANQSAFAARTNGNGSAAEFYTTKPGNATPTVYIVQSGNGSVIEGVTTGGADFIVMKDGGQARYILDNSGSIVASGSMVLSSYASATTYFGDGSNLTGITGVTDYVHDTGDNMTGALSVVYGSTVATPTLKVVGPGGSSGYTAYFQNDAATAAVFAINNFAGGDGVGIRGESLNSYGVVGRSENFVGVFGQSFNDIGLFGESANSFAGYFKNANAGNTNSTLFASSGSATSTIYASNTDNGPSAIGVHGRSTGSGTGVYGQSDTGYGVKGYSMNAPAVYGEGLNDRAAVFVTTMNSNATDVLYVESWSGQSGSSVIGGNHMGSDGKLINMRTGGVPAFVVDFDGSVHASGSMVLTSYASATTYFGDGSNLTGISGTGVATTGDTMTGALFISQGAATSSISAYQTGAGEAAGHFEVTNNGNAVDAVLISTNSNSGGNALNVSHTGGDGIALKVGSTVGNFSPAMSVLHSGDGNAARFETDDPTNATATVYVTTNTTAGGLALVVTNTGTTGNAVNIETTNVVNTSPTLDVTTAGLASAASFENTNAGSSSSTVNITTNTNGNGIRVVTTGTGKAGTFSASNAASVASALYVSTTSAIGTSAVIEGDHKGSSGNILVMKANSTPVMSLDRGGNIFASGSVQIVKNSSGDAAMFEITDPSNASASVYLATNSTTGGNALTAINSGSSGNVASFVTTNGANTSKTLDVVNAGLGGAAGFSNTNALYASSTVNITTNGTGNGIRVVNTGTGGRAGLLNVSNTTNPSSALTVTTNSAQSASAVIEADHKGTAGNILAMKANSVSVAYMDRTGSLYASGSVVVDGFASATTYFGDGSNLTGISGSGVATTGDVMTGPLEISQGGATASLSVYQTGTTDPAGMFVLSNVGSSEPIIEGSTTGSGALLLMRQGAAAKFVVDNTGNVYATGSVDVDGGFVSGVTSNGQTAFSATGGNANGIYINNPGTNGKVAQFIVTSGGNPNPVITATTQSNARAAYFENSAATATLYLKQNGSGDVLAGETSGASGYLINLKAAATPRFVVDTSGNIFASGTLSLGAGGFVSTSGDAMTGGLKIDYDSTTAALHVRDGASPSNAVFIEDIGKNFATSTLYVKTNNANAGSYGIYSYTTGSGMPGYFQVDNGANPADAIQATTNGGGSAFYGINTGTGSGGYFNINNAGNGSAAVDASTNGSGRAGWFKITNAGSGADVIDASTGGSGDAVQGTNTGIGRAGYFAISNAANSVSAMVVTTNGAGSAGSFSATNPGNTLAALAATNSGTAATSYGVAGTADGAGSGIYGYSASNGNGVYGYNSGTGIAGYFQVNNAASGGNAIYATSNGVGRAVDISITNGTNVNSAMYVSHAGTGEAVYGESSSASTGKAGYFTNTNAANTVAALSGVTAGSSASSYGVFGQAMGGGSAIYGQNSGVGYGVQGYNTSTGYAVYGLNSSNTTGKAGYFTNSNAANTVAALTGITVGTSVTSYGVYGEAAGNGTGVVGKSLGGGTGITGENSGTLGFAAYFLNSNAGSTAPLISGNHNGSGKLLQLQKSAVEKFVVDNNGVVITQGCPAGMVNAGNFCIDANETASSTWDGAASACLGATKQLCTPAQWYGSCNSALPGLNTMTDNFEWLDAVFFNGGVQSMAMGSGGCYTFSNNALGTNLTYRCCYNK